MGTKKYNFEVCIKCQKTFPVGECDEGCKYLKEYQASQEIKNGN